MHNALLDRSTKGLHAVRGHLSFSAALRAVIAVPIVSCSSATAKCPDFTPLFAGAVDATSWKVIDHCTGVSRTYALFEEFVIELLQEYIAFLSAHYAFKEFDDEFKAKYTRGVGQILVDQDKAAYKTIDIPTLLNESAAAVSGGHPYMLQPEALLRKDQNLRMPELQRLFAQCGLLGVESWVNKHPAVSSFFASASRLSDTATSELKEAVGYRNEASHGDVDQVLGTDVLLELTEFYEAVIVSLRDFVQYDSLRRSKDLGVAEILGKVSESFNENRVVALIESSTIKRYDTVYLFGKGRTALVQITNLQLEGVDTESVVVGEQREVGLQLDRPAKVGVELVRLK